MGHLDNNNKVCRTAPTTHCELWPKDFCTKAHKLVLQSNASTRITILNVLSFLQTKKASSCCCLSYGRWIRTKEKNWPLLSIFFLSISKWMKLLHRIKIRQIFPTFLKEIHIFNTIFHIICHNLPSILIKKITTLQNISVTFSMYEQLWPRPFYLTFKWLVANTQTRAKTGPPRGCSTNTVKI